MHPINIIRLQAGIVIDQELEKTPPKQRLVEAREAPKRRADLKKVDKKILKTQIRHVKQGIAFLEKAIEHLGKIPVTDYNALIPCVIGEIEDQISPADDSGLAAYLENCSVQLRKIEGEENSQARKDKQEEEYEEYEASREATEMNAAAAEYDSTLECDPNMANENKGFSDFILSLSDDNRQQLIAAMNVLKKITDGNVIGESKKALNIVTDIAGKRLEEAMHYYNVNYSGFVDDVDKPINVVDGTTNNEQVWDEAEEKNESPAQLKTMDQQDNSPVDKTGDDLSNKMRIPKDILNSLRTEITKAKKESEMLDVRDKDASYFYRDLAKAFQDLLNHLEKGTVYDFKQAQVFSQTLMGPMLHKIPNKVWKFLTNGGETRSLKSYMTDVSKDYPILGPRNTIK